MADCTTTSGKGGKKIAKKQSGRIPVAKAKKQSGRIPVGAKVVLAPGWKKCGDAAKGPMKAGDVGILRTDDKTGKPYKVKFDGKSWWCVDACRVISPRA